MFKKILVPSDGSTQAHKAAEVAADLAKSQGAEVVGVYVIDPFPFIGIGDASAAGLQAYLAEAKSVAGQALDALGKVCAAEGVRLMEAFMYRLHPSWVAVRGLVASGFMGVLQWANVRLAGQAACHGARAGSPF